MAGEVVDTAYVEIKPKVDPSFGSDVDRAVASSLRGVDRTVAGALRPVGTALDNAIARPARAAADAASRSLAPIGTAAQRAASTTERAFDGVGAEIERNLNTSGVDDALSDVPEAARRAANTTEHAFDGVGREIDQDIEQGTRGAGESLNRLSGQVKGLIGGFLAFQGVGLLKGFIGDAEEANKITALTNKVIETTGGVAKVTAQQVTDLASAIATKTGIDDAAIQTGENVLLTFTNVRNEVGKGNDVFNQATQAATDMVAALNNGDVSAEALKGQTIQLGKALNDPIKGVSALARVGVSFTDQQKEQIKTLVESGKTVEAQKIILGEVKKEFGGAAEASATAGKKLGFALGEVGESIGNALLPAVNLIVNAILNGVIPGMTTAANAVSKVTGPIIDLVKNSETLQTILLAVGAAVVAVAVAYGTYTAATAIASGVSKAFTAVQAALNAVLEANPIGIVVLAIVALVAVMFVLYKRSQTVRDIVDTVGAVLKDKLGAALHEVGDFIKNEVLPRLQELGAFFQTNILPILQVVGTVVGKVLVTYFRIYAAIISNVIIPALKILWSIFSATIIPILKVLYSIIKNAVIVIFRGLGVELKVLGVVFRFIGKIIEAWKNGAQRAFSAAGSAFRKLGEVFGSVKERISGFIGGIVDAITGLPGKIAALGSKMLSAGKTLMSKLFDGLQSAAGAAGGFASNIAKSIANNLISALNNVLPHTLSIHKGPINIDVPLFPTIPAFAKGGIFDRATLGVFGEDGKEAIIPLSRKYAQEAANIITKSGILDRQDILQRVQAPSRATIAGAGSFPGRSVESPARGTAGLPSGLPAQPAPTNIQINQNFYGPTTSGGRLREIDWTMRYATRARAAKTEGVAT